MPIARIARSAFRGSSRLPARALALPSWVASLVGLASPEIETFWQQEWPAVTLVDSSRWAFGRTGAGPVPDVDRMAAALPGIVAAAVHLAGGRA